MFYDRFVDLCKEKGLSPAAVTRELGLNNSSSTAWKRGSIPKSDTLKKLADYFDVSTDYLLGTRTRQNRPTINVGNTYLDGAMRIEEIDESDNRLQVTFSVETDELSIEDLDALVAALNRLSKDYKMTVSGITQIMEAVANSFYKAQGIVPPGTPEAPPVPQEGTDTTPPPDAPETPPEDE